MKGKDARVGSSDPQALFIMIFSFFVVEVSCVSIGRSPRRDKPANCESRARSCRRTIRPPSCDSACTTEPDWAPVNRQHRSQANLHSSSAGALSLRGFLLADFARLRLAQNARDRLAD